MKSPKMTELEFLRQKIIDLVHKNPDKTAIILANWLKKPAREPRLKKKVA
jgi:hypothetical protein